MSTHVMSLCWPIRLPPTQKAVLISLADNANDDGECWPSIPTICMRTCFSERAVHRAIAELEAAGLLHADRSNGRHTRYVLTPANAAQPQQQVRPRISGAPANAAVNPRISGSDPRKCGSKPPQEVRSNRKEPSLKATVIEPKDSELDQLLADIPKALLADYQKIRKAKKAPLTATAVKGLTRECGKAGITLQAGIEICCERGWSAVKADWLKPHERAGPNGKPSAAADFRNTTYTGTPYDELPPDLR